MSTDLIQIGAEDQFAAIDSIAAEFQRRKEDVGPSALMALTANAMIALKKAIPEEFAAKIKEGLEDSRIGFKTDKKGKGGYPVPIIQEVLCEALLLGLQPVNNEVNIIAGNLYATKEGFTGLMLRNSEFSDFRWQYQEPEVKGKRAIVRFSASWKFRGVADKIENDMVICKTDDYTTPDAILGKAERKVRKKVWEICSGQNIPDADTASDVTVTVKQSDAMQALGAPPEEDAPQEAEFSEDVEETLLKFEAKAADYRGAEDWQGVQNVLNEVKRLVKKGEIPEEAAKPLIGALAKTVSHAFAKT